MSTLDTLQQLPARRDAMKRSEALVALNNAQIAVDNAFTRREAIHRGEDALTGARSPEWERANRAYHLALARRDDAEFDLATAVQP